MRTFVHSLGATALILASLSGVACKQQGGGTSAAAPAGPLNTEEEKTLYALGLYMGRNLQQFNLKPEEMSLVERGIRDQVSGAQAQVDLQAYFPKINELSRARAGDRSKVEKEKGAAFAAKAASEQGAEKLPSGVIYIPIKEGEGANPTANDSVKVHYRGTLVDGTEFDSSYKRNQPASFALRGVVKCWTEGLQKMKPGGKAKLVCPSDTAYGDQGRPSIPGGATLLFEVELLEITAPAAPAPNPHGAATPPPAGATPPPK